MSLESDVERGMQAQRLLKDPLIVEAFSTLRQTLLEAFERCPIRDREGQHELRLMLELLGQFKSFFDLAVSDGELAAQTIHAREESKKGYSPAQWKREYYGY